MKILFEEFSYFYTKNIFFHLSWIEKKLITTIIFYTTTYKYFSKKLPQGVDTALCKVFCSSSGMRLLAGLSITFGTPSKMLNACLST